MQALEVEKTDNPLIVNLLEMLSRLCERADIVFFGWLLRHIGIIGNEVADKAAKDALSLEISPLRVPFNSFKALLIISIKICGSNPGVIQPTKATKCLLLSQVLANGFKYC